MKAVHCVCGSNHHGVSIELVEGSVMQQALSILSATCARLSLDNVYSWVPCSLFAIVDKQLNMDKRICYKEMWRGLVDIRFYFKVHNQSLTIILDGVKLKGKEFFQFETKVEARAE